MGSYYIIVKSGRAILLSNGRTHTNTNESKLTPAAKGRKKSRVADNRKTRDGAKDSRKKQLAGLVTQKESSCSVFCSQTADFLIIIIM